MREGYKKTEVGIIPEDWEVKSIGEISSLVTKGTTPTTLGFDFQSEGINYIRSENINQFGRFEGDYLKISKECNEKLQRSKIYENDILVSIVGYYLGKAAIVTKYECPANTNQNVAIIRIANNNYNNNYIKIIFDSIYLKKYINQNLTVGAQPSLSLEQIKKFKLPIPSLKEQEKIAEILSTVDSQIDDTEKLIEKSKELKKGLMQKLLTKGIGHSEFKKTEVGEIPVEWKIHKVSSITNLIKSGLSRKLSDENIGIPCLRSNNIKESKLNLDDLKYWYLVDDKGANISDYILDNGDIIMNFINSPSQIGKGCIFNKNNLDCIYSTNLLRIKLDEEKMLTKFFYYYTQTERYKKEIMLITKPAVNQASFTTTEFKEIKFPVPTIKEQNRIVDILSSVDKKIDEYENKKQKLEDVKKGLMQQLLTGKIRITI